MNEKLCLGTVVAALLGVSGPAAAATEASAVEVAAFWNTVFNGPSPQGVPQLNPSRSNQRVSGNVTLWDVAFDSYRDPDTDAPLRIYGVLAVPNNVAAPGPGGTYPALVSTHSVGVAPPVEGESTAIYYAEKGYIALGYFGRGYAPSLFTNPALNTSTSQTAFCENMVEDGLEPFDTLWAGIPMDAFQAAQFMALQPEVWDGNDIAFIGHSLGGYVGLMAGVFSPRYRTIATSAPPTTSPDINAWMAFGNPISGCADRLPGDSANNTQLAVRMLSYIGAWQAVNNPSMAWSLQNKEIWFYGGELDTAVPPADVAATYQLADASNNKALHWSPIGGHGGPESFNRAEAWLDGHYPGRAQSPPTAAIAVAAQNQLVVDFDGTGSTDDDLMVAWDWDFGDSVTQNWGPTISHAYSTAGTYTASLTVTGGEGQRDTATVQVTVAGTVGPQFVVTAPDPIRVDEGGTTSFTFNLSAVPAGTTNVTLTRLSGDVDLSVSGPSSFAFDAANWMNPQSATLAAATDADGFNGTAVFELSAPGLLSVELTAVEVDPDGTFSYTIADVTASPGTLALVPITLSNAAGRQLSSFELVVEFDGSVFTAASATRGAAVPGPAFWNFTVTSVSASSIRIRADDFILAGGDVLIGDIALLELSVDPAASPGTYAVTGLAGLVDDAPVSEVISGGVQILAAGDGGIGGDGGTSPDSGVPGDGGGGGQDPRGCACDAGSGGPAAAWWWPLAVLFLRRRRQNPPR